MTITNDHARALVAELELKASDLVHSTQGLRRLLSADRPAPDPIIDSGFRLSTKSLQRLEGVHPDLIAVVQHAIRASTVDFGITRTGGVRSRETQRRLVEAGKSGTMRSRHRTGHAVDIFPYVDGAYSKQPKHAMSIHDAFEAAGEALDVPLRWGGNWDMDGDIREPGENDLVHHELPRRDYGTDPASLNAKATAYLFGITNGAP